MATVNFTTGRVASHACEAGRSQSFIWDSGQPGLGLRATAGGAKAFVYQGKVAGATVRLTIGDPATWSIGKARGEARRLQLIVDAGRDPRIEAGKVAAGVLAERQRMTRERATLADGWNAWVEARREKWGAHHLRGVLTATHDGADGAVRGPLADLMPLRLAALDKDAIALVLERETHERPARARLCWSYLRTALRWIDEQPEYAGLLPASARSRSIATDHLAKPQAKTDALERGHLAAWFQALDVVPTLSRRVYLAGLLLTGARREELAALRWRDVSLEWHTLSIADKVEDAGRVIPLTPYFQSLLEVLHEQSGGAPDAFVFPSTASPNKSLTRVCKVAGVPRVTLHGLRRSYGSLSEWIELPAGVVAQIMGHKPSATAERHYRVRPVDLLRLHATKLERFIVENAGIAFAYPAARGALEVAA
ncbi:integrase family protein [Paraburkholderia sp. MMS20-SJTN17]|uniref:Integrase family protein n=1 Tax=Paraburkholderia translucens TaxID=2886945 RepID=A0ABS8K8Y0_9BURK|nr:integrase family protein [Paraburkholderia sp. MMS20-SJTN17]MCC8400958.1 integrase family protein [Paraburkholderia sp. MMS20-SJTN17]